MGKGIPIQILGAKFSIQTDEDPEYVEKLVRYVTRKIESLQKTVATKDPIRLAFLAAILVTDELFKERSGVQSSGNEDGNDLETITNGIIARLDEILEN